MPPKVLESQNIASSPLVNSLADSLTNRVRSGSYTEQTGFPTERDLVEEFGVSRNIVRRALDILEERELIVRAARCRTMLRTPVAVASPPPGKAAVGRSPKIRRNLGFSIWPGANDPGTIAVIRGIYNVLDHSAFRLIMGHVLLDAPDVGQRMERQFLEQMLDDKDIAGILLWHHGGDSNAESFRKVRDAGIPIVFLDRMPPESFPADYVGVANEDCALQAVRHLIKMGHRSIAHITNLDVASTVAERKAGYRRALEMAGISFRPELIVTATESSVEEVSALYTAMVEQLFSVSDPPTAVFAVNDLIADRFVQAVRATGRRVPEEVAVAGFDGLERWANRPPFLTTVYQPFEALGEKATRLLLERIERPENTAYQHVLLDAPLHIHGSTVLSPASSGSGLSSPVPDTLTPLGAR